MDISQTILTDTISPPQVLPHVKGIENASDEKKKEIAKELESVFVHRLLDELNKTSGLGMEEDSTTGQIRGIFNFCLAEFAGKAGGFGLWKEIYQSLKQLEQGGDEMPPLLDSQA